MIFVKFVFTAFLFAFTSCDCLIKIHGTVIESESKNPINDVEVYMTIRNSTLKNLCYYPDSITIQQRDSINKKNKQQKKNWEKEGWHRPVFDNIKNYVKDIPCISDSLGNYNLYYFTGICPKYSLKFVKEGYNDLIIPEKLLRNFRDSQSKRIVVEMKKINSL